MNEISRGLEDMGIKHSLSLEIHCPPLTDSVKWQ